MPSFRRRRNGYSMLWRAPSGEQHSLFLGDTCDLEEAADRFVAAVLDAGPGEVQSAYRRLERFEAGLRRFLEDTADA